MKKRLLCFCLALLLCLPLLCACHGKAADLVLIKKGTSDYCIIYPEGEKDTQAIADTLSQILHTLTGVLLEVKSDSAEETETEILVGYTNRQASQDLLATIKTQASTFAIAVSDKQVVLTATGKILLHAAEFFLSSTKEQLGGSYREGYLSLPRTLSYIGSVKFPESNVKLISSTAQLALRQSSKDLVLEELSENDRLYSITTDGTYLYAVVKVAGEDQARICQLTASGSLESSSNSLDLGLAPSLCYNALTGLLVVVHGGSNAQRLSLVDPQTMKVQSTVELDVAVSAIAYLAQSNRYLVKLQNENTCYLLNGAFQREGEPITLPRALASNAAKGMTADERYIYFLQNNNELFLVDRYSTRYQSFALPFYLTNEQMPVSLCIYQKAFLFATVVTPKQSEGKPYNMMQTATWAQTAADAALGELFTEDMIAEVDSYGLSSAKLFDAYTIGGSPAKNTVMQGGCTDGKYAYICMENQAGNYSNTYLHDTRIVKVNLSTGRLVRISEPLKLHHSNDMCYNALTGQLIVLHNGMESNILSFIDPETLTVTGTQFLPMNVYSIAHEPTTDRYVVGKSGGRNYAILDGNFRVLVSHVDVGPYTYYTDTNPVTQGIDCDEKYIYAVLGVKNTDTNQWTNYMVVHDWNGTYLFAKILPNITAESENIFHIGNTIFVGCNGGNDPVYRLNVTD